MRLERGTQRRQVVAAFENQRVDAYSPCYLTPLLPYRLTTLPPHYLTFEDREDTPAAARHLPRQIGQSARELAEVLGRERAALGQ